MSEATEVELKLRLPRSAVGALRAHAALRAATSGRARRAKLDATYFDTPDLALARRGIALRVRRERGRWIQTAKGGGITAGGLAQRVEEECDLGRGTRRPAPDLSALAGTPLGRELARTLRRSIGPVFATTFVRTTLPLAFPDGTTGQAAIDIGRARTIGAKRGSTAFCELELELACGAVARLFELAALLVADLPLAIEPRTKAQRGYGLVAPVAATPRHAERPDYEDAATAAAALSAILRSALAQIEGNADGVAEAEDPEWIHQLRVGIRRLRSALVLARPLADVDGLRSTEEEARWIARVLGSARDLDVFVGETLPALRAALTSSGPTEAVDALAAAARPHLATARRDARLAVRSARFQRLLLALGALAASPPQHAADVTANAFARGALRRRHRQLMRAGASIDGASPDQRHQVRIAAKKLRYAAEFFAPLFPARQVAPYTRALSGLQDVLGRLNDATTAAAIAAAVASPGSPAPALVAGWAAGSMSGEERLLRRAWKRFRQAKPFWKDATGD